MWNGFLVKDGSLLNRIVIVQECDAKEAKYLFIAG